MATLIFLLYSLTFTAYADQGPGIDPNGHYVTVHSDEGPGICPHGGKSASTTADIGGALDPNG